MKKKLLTLLSLLSVMTVAAFSATGCFSSGDSSEGTSSVVESPSESVAGGSEDVTDSEESTESSEGSSEEVATPSITLSETTLAVELYASATLTAELKNSEETVVWTSSDEAVVKVVDGVVTAYKAGTATVTATAGELSASCEITVAASDEAPVFADLVETLSLIKGTSEYLDVALTYKGEAFNLATVSVTTEGEKLSIGEEYEVIANEYGQQTVTVTAKVGEEVVATATVTVDVIEFGTLVVNLPENKLSMNIGEEGYALSSIQAMVNGTVLEAPVFTVVSTDENIVKEVEGKLVPVTAGEAEVTVSFTTEIATYDTKINVIVCKLSETKEVNFLVQGSNGVKVAETGDATVDLSATGIDLTQVSKVLCGETEVTFAIDGTNLTLTDAPGGYQLYTLVTPTVDYIIDGCVYGYAISTAEEFIEWRKDVYYNIAYTVLLNDIDLEGQKLPSMKGEAQLKCTLDGRGYTISNFSFGYDYGMFYYIYANGAVKNLQLVNVVQDCTGQPADAHVKMGIFGDNLMGAIENVLLKVTVKNMVEGKDHYGMLAWYFSETAVAKNVVIYAEAQGCAPHYFYACAAGGMEGCVIDNVRFVSVGTGLGVSGKEAINSGAHVSVDAMLKEASFDTWGGLWQVTEEGLPYMSDYTDNESAPTIVVNGKATLGATLTFDTTSFYPLTYTLSETAGVTLTENNEVVIGLDAVIDSEFTVTVTCAAMPAYSKTLSFVVEKEAVAVEGIVLAQGNGTKWSYDTGVATLDLTEKGVDLTDVLSVEIDGAAFDGYTVDGNKLVLTNAPGGDHIFTISTATHTYTVKGSVYVVGISTVEELEAWRTSESYWYAALLNDIDYEGATLTTGANVLGVLDGRGYTIKNFTMTKGFVNSVYAKEAAIKNIQFLGVTQDCSFASYPTYGLLGGSIAGTVENIYLEVKTINLEKEHCGVLAGELKTTGVMKNTVVYITEGSNAHYVLDAHNGLDENYANNFLCYGGGYTAHYAKRNGSWAGFREHSWNSRIDWLFSGSPALAQMSGYWHNDAKTLTISLQPWA